MRVSSTVLAVLTFSAWGLAVTGQAAWAKNQPAPDWAVEAAKTATPASAESASSLLLFSEKVEHFDKDGRMVEHIRTATRILKPQGREDAYCAVVWDVDEKIISLHSWTIAADGKQFEAKDTDAFEEGGGGTRAMIFAKKVKVIRPLAADPGNTVICESEELLPSYQHEIPWHFQRDYPVVAESLEVDLPAGAKFAESWHRYTAVKPKEVSPNHWRWDLHDVPALDLRNLHAPPPEAGLFARMSVLLDDLAQDGKDNQWRALGKWCEQLQTNRPAPSAEFTAQTQQLIQGAPDFYTKLAHITEHIQKHIRYFVVERGIGGWQAHYAADIFHNQYGDCKDKTTLLISMLQVAGIQAYYMPVDMSRGFVDPDAPSFYGNHMITAIELPADVKDDRLAAISTAKNGKRYLIFDPTNETAPVGNLPDYLQGGWGILSDGNDSQILQLPILASEWNGSERKGEFTLSADGSLQGKSATTHTGPEGADLRRLIKLTEEKERREFLEKRLSVDLPGLTLDSVKVKQPESLNQPVVFEFGLTARQYAHQAGPLILVRPRVLGSLAIPFDQKPRTLPIDLGSTGHWKDSFDIHLPEGYVVDELPRSINVDFDFASYHAKTTSTPGGLHYEREYIVRQVEIPAERAADFRRLEGAIVFDEKGTAVLKKQ